MLRLAVCAALASHACSPAQAPRAMAIGKVTAIGGVIGLIATAVSTRYVSTTEEMLIGFSLVSGLGIVTYAWGELSAEPVVKRETLPERHHRWAKILTERAAGAAREGRCARVRRLEGKVRMYDAEVHDFVFMRDPEILRCLEETAVPSPTPDVPPQVEPAPITP
ncbi:MAG: hypothetical protein WKG01_03780 [Kofleriaceae bacterium]